jgi:hypothetical protein
MHSHSRWHERSQLPPTYHCKLDSISFTSAFESGSAGAYLVQTKDDISRIVLKILTEMDFLLDTDEEMFSFRARLAATYRKIYVLMTIPPHLNILGPPSHS